MYPSAAHIMAAYVLKNSNEGHQDDQEHRSSVKILTRKPVGFMQSCVLIKCGLSDVMEAMSSLSSLRCRGSQVFPVFA